MFRLLSLVPGGGFGVAPAAVLAGVPLPDAEDLLEELLEAGLLMTSRQDRYRLHDLLRLYAASRHRAEDSTERSFAARSRLRHWLLDTAVLAGRWYEPDYGMPPADPGRLVALDDREQAARWIRTEGDSWLAAFREAAANGEHTRVAEVAEAMHWFSDHWVSWGHWVEVYERAAAAGPPSGTPVWRRPTATTSPGRTGPAPADTTRRWTRPGARCDSPRPPETSSSRRGRTRISAGCGTPSATCRPPPPTTSAPWRCSRRRTTSTGTSRSPAE
ncbi:hypothetical protein KEF29_15545 [Streptomyces tuirus]|uniref:Uncharacterized protein n=1 Tax=Streptomyces tuirus TaxID=68278 RepID=A0A941J344_9ACTN|nr:hypothetical protein [Streptomyces tuirus]